MPADRKTLACDTFPFREIIDEFLVPKDQAVDAFQRRKPNLLLMQNFALDKMEWPKHYTSKKVLVLMTYTELMNRSQGTQSSAQIQPVRIYKRRIRNGISCFEVMWRTPDHYVFPEDGPEDESGVVRTVEEENLFTVAFPDVVQLFHKETTEAKDNKLKKRKPNAGKDKASGSSDGMSEVFAQMSLENSPHLDPIASSQKGVWTRTVLKSDPDRCSASTLTTASKLPDPSEVQSASGAPLSSSRQQSDALASPQAQSCLSVSVVIDELHLSSIDWDASLGSFTAAPSPPTRHAKADPQAATQKPDAGTQGEGPGSSTTVRSTCVELAALQIDRLSERSLMERVRLRTVPKNMEEKESKVREPSYTLGSGDKPWTESPKVLPDSQSELSTIHNVASDSKDKTRQPKGPVPAPVPPKGPVPAPVETKSRFAKPKHFKRSSSNPQQTNKVNAWKTSACRRQGYSGDNSDVENQPPTKQQENTLKVRVDPEPRIPQKTVLAQELVKKDRCDMFANSGDTRHGSDSTTPAKQPQNVGFSQTQTHGTKSDDDDDDDDASTCSPLPLAERLKLKLIK